MSVIISIDQNKCAGHARCHALADDVFELDEEGFVLPIDAPLDESMRTRAERGAAGCPERAITVSSG